MRPHSICAVGAIILAVATTRTVRCLVPREPNTTWNCTGQMKVAAEVERTRCPPCSCGQPTTSRSKYAKTLLSLLRSSQARAAAPRLWHCSPACRQLRRLDWFAIPVTDPACGSGGNRERLARSRRMRAVFLGAAPDLKLPPASAPSAMVSLPFTSGRQTRGLLPWQVRAAEGDRALRTKSDVVRHARQRARPPTDVEAALAHRFDSHESNQS